MSFINQKKRQERPSFAPLRNVPLALLYLSSSTIVLVCALVYFCTTAITSSRALVIDSAAQGIAASLSSLHQSNAADLDSAVRETTDSLAFCASHYTFSLFILDDGNHVVYTQHFNTDAENPLPLSSKFSVLVPAQNITIDTLQDTYRGTLLYIGSRIGSNYHLYAVFPTRQFTDSSSFIRLSLITACILIVGNLAVFFLLRRYFLAPSKQLLRAVRNRERPYVIEPYLSWRNEAGALCSAYYSREADYNANIEKINQLNNEKRETELDVLQNQINSHFIFNTLNNVQWLASAGRTTDVIKTVQSLAQLLRACAHNENDFVTIEEELGYVEAYLTIQQIRFGDTFQFEIDVDPLQLQMKIPKFILQPLVENSIYHGFLDIGKTDGIIRISLKKRGHRIDICVHDNGAGIERARIHNILINRQKSSDRYMGVAIGNINKRIRLLCGREYGLGIKSEPGKYTDVEITLPILTEQIMR